MDTVIKYTTLNAMNKCTQNHMSCRKVPYHNAYSLYGFFEGILLEIVVGAESPI